MENFRQNIDRWLRLERYTDEREYMRMVVLYIVLAINGLIAGVATLITLVSGSPQAPFAVLSLLLTLGLAVLAWRQGPVLVSWLIPGIAFFLAFLLSFNGAGLNDIGIFVFPAVIATAGLLLRQRGVVVFTVLSILAVIWIGIVQMSPGAEAPQAQAPMLRLALVVVILGMVGVVDYVLIALLAFSLEQAHINQAKMLKTNQELQAIRVSLEEQVEERTRRVDTARKESEAARHAIEAQMWLATGQAQLSEAMRGEQELPNLAHNIIQHLCIYLDAQVGALFILQESELCLAGGYALGDTSIRNFQLGEGLVGQAALDQRTITLNQVDGYDLKVRSGLGSASPRQVVCQPFLNGSMLVGVLELGALETLHPRYQQYLARVQSSIAIAFQTALARQRVNQLLAETQRQAAELQAQEEELRAVNEELQAQADALRMKGRA